MVPNIVVGDSPLGRKLLQGVKKVSLRLCKWGSLLSVLIWFLFFARRGAVIALSFGEPQSWATGMPAPLHFLVNGAARSMH